MKFPSASQWRRRQRGYISVSYTHLASLEKDVLSAVEEVNDEVMSVFSEDECESLKAHLRLLAGVDI